MIKIFRLIALILFLFSSATAFSAPQHWGFGFGYLVVLEQTSDGNKVLSVYEPPLRVKDCPWLLRWRDSSGQFKDVPKNGIAVGDFFPKPIGKEYLVAIVGEDDKGLKGRIFDPPETFSTRTWKPIGDFVLPTSGNGESLKNLVGITAGKPLGSTTTDLLITLCKVDLKESGYRLNVYSPPEKDQQNQWNLIRSEFLKATEFEENQIESIACTNFSGGKKTLSPDSFDSITFASNKTTYFGQFSSLNLPSVKPVQKSFQIFYKDNKTAVKKGISLFGAYDFLKDGFDYIVIGDSVNKIEFRTAPPVKISLSTSELQAPSAVGVSYLGNFFNTIWVRENETFAGAKLEGGKPGESFHIMTGELKDSAGTPIASAAGRIFGYIIPGCDERKEKIWKPWVYQGFNDVEISFAHRTPVNRITIPKKWQDANWPWEPDDHFGWPLKGEEITYEVNIKNNGKETIPAGKITLKAWVDTPNRNADTKPDAAKTMNFTAVIDKPLPPFDPAKPEYHIVKITFPWPYDLVQPEGWTWKRINVAEIGERWLIMRLEYAGDENERNDRYDLALNARLFRPVFRFDDEMNTLTFRAPTITGDPESKEYIASKIADAVQCMWERSRTSKGEDVLQRVAFVGYRLSKGLSSDRTLDWSLYEGPRDLDRWIGLWGDYERSDPWDGGAELHETGHLFHPLGDLYHYYVNPTYTRHIKMADGVPVQMYTYAWGRDSFCDGQAIIGEGGSDLQKYMEGARIGLGHPWHKMMPEKVYVRVLDRDGKPVEGMNIKWWNCSPTEHREEGNGVTGADGRWLSSITRGERSIYEPFNIPLRDDPVYDALAHLFTFEINGYTDFMILGAEDVTSHSRHTLMQKSLTNRAEWTWDFKTLYKPGAPKPKFDLVSGVEGRNITLSVTSEPGKTYRLYRRWEPTYVYKQIDEKKADGKRLEFKDDMGAKDWFGGNRYRAVYYVTEIADGIESLPKRVYGIATDKVNGITDLGNGKLLIALNCGKAEPFGAIFDGTTPAEEYIKHFRFGHTAVKIVPSKSGLERFYATLVGSDADHDDAGPHKFDLIQFDKPDRFEGHYPVLGNLSSNRVKAYSTKAPYTMELEDDRRASCAANIGDIVSDEEKIARIIAINGNTIELDKPLFSEEGKDHSIRIIPYAGEDGNGTVNRQLKNSRGLAVLKSDGNEYVALADFGNGRVVVWDSTTKFIAEYKQPDFTPAGVAVFSGNDENRIIVIDRKKDRKSRLVTLEFVDNALEETGEPMTVDVGDGENGPEVGIAVALDPKDGKYLIAITDASNKRIIEYKQDGNGWKQTAVYTKLVGTFAGTAELMNPTDCAYSQKGEELHLYAVDNHTRVVQLR